MPATTTVREDRIELRATKDEKQLLAQAAAYERLDVTSFIMRNVLPTARDVVDRAERIVLSERDTVRVLELLENPPKPTPALLAAARRRALFRPWPSIRPSPAFGNPSTPHHRSRHSSTRAPTIRSPRHR